MEQEINDTSTTSSITINRPKTILINSRLKDQNRLAIIDSKTQRLIDLDIEQPGAQKKANIYKGTITKIEEPINAVFVRYSSSNKTRHGFLPFKEIAPEYFLQAPQPGTKLNMSELLREGQEVMIQVDKEERGSKGAALTTYATLAGCYLVLLPNTPNSGGISRRIEGEERGEMRDVIDALSVPDGMSVIVRTAGMGKDPNDLIWDLSVLLKQWDLIKQSYQTRTAPCLLFKESDIIVRAARDYLRTDVDSIVIDDEDTFEKASRYMNLVRPEFTERLVHYQDKQPLFQRYQVEKQIDTIYHRELNLPSGGTIVIDRTEAMVTVDVNSASASGGKDIEQTALQTNKEAAMEVARQLRLRDIGGLIVIDFIDMLQVRNQREVENCLRDAISDDRARIQMGRISRFGLLEMSRQRLRPSFSETSQVTCLQCQGQGILRSTESMALTIMRHVLEDAQRPGTGVIQVQVPVAVATYLLNEKRTSVIDLEQKLQVGIVIIANPHLNVPEYKVQLYKRDESGGNPVKAPSYQLASKPDHDPNVHMSQTSTPVIEHAAVESVVEANPRSSSPPASADDGFFKKIFKKLFNESAGNDESTPQQKTRSHSRHQGHGTRPHGNSNNRHRHNNYARNKRRRGGSHSSSERTEQRAGNHEHGHTTLTEQRTNTQHNDPQRQNNHSRRSNNHQRNHHRRRNSTHQGADENTSKQTPSRIDRSD